MLEEMTFKKHAVNLPHIINSNDEDNVNEIDEQLRKFKMILKFTMRRWRVMWTISHPLSHNSPNSNFSGISSHSTGKFKRDKPKKSKITLASELRAHSIQMEQTAEKKIDAVNQTNLLEEHNDFFFSHFL